MTKRALVLGGNGLIGHTIAETLQTLGYKVTIADKRQKPDSNLPFIQLDVLKREALFRLIEKVKPHIIVNCINIATICSGDKRHGLTRIINFYTYLYRALAKTKPDHYIQVGTTGSGGLGFNIPFTHGEDIENLPIIHKAAFSGITTSLLTLLSRSFPGETIVSEMKPGLAVFSKKPVLQTFDHYELFAVDGGESGYYTYNELALLTTWMGFTTVERIGEKLIDIMKQTTVERKLPRYDITQTLNSAIISADAIDLADKREVLGTMKKELNKLTIIATGNLGPSAITRDLILAHLRIKHDPKSQHELNELMRTDMAIAGTLDYIKHRDKKLYRLMHKECTFEAYKAITKYYEPGSEPWMMLKQKFEKLLPT